MLDDNNLRMKKKYSFVSSGVFFYMVKYTLMHCRKYSYFFSIWFRSLFEKPPISYLSVINNNPRQIQSFAGVLFLFSRKRILL